jgi:cold shock protein
METGTVRWFDPVMGFGFIRLASGAPDVFVHVSNVRRAGLVTLSAGQKIRFDLSIRLHSGKTTAYNIEAE